MLQNQNNLWNTQLIIFYTAKWLRNVSIKFSRPKIQIWHVQMPFHGKGPNCKSEVMLLLSATSPAGQSSYHPYMAHAHSKLQIRYDNARNAEDWISAATHAFEQAKRNSELLHKPHPNLSDIAHQYRVSEATLCWRVKGGRSRLTAAADRSWLTEAQTQTLISHLHTLAECGCYRYLNYLIGITYPCSRLSTS